MKNTIFSFIKIILPFILVIINACEPDKDAIVLSTRLKLTVAEYDSTEKHVYLDWNKPLMANFQYYLIFRYDEIPPPLDKGTVCYQDSWGDITCYEGLNLNGYYEKVSDADQTEYSDDQMLITDKLYYRIVAVGDSILISNVKMVELLDIEKIDFLPTNVSYYSENNSLLLHGTKDQENIVISYDLDKKEIADSLDLNMNSYMFSYSYSGLVMSHFQGKADLYVWNYDMLYQIDPSTLSIVSASNNFDYILDVEGDNAGHLFVRCNNDNLFSYNRNNLSVPISTQINYYGHRLFYFNNELLCIEQSSYPDYFYYAVNTDGSLSLVDDGYLVLSSQLAGDFDREGGYFIGLDGTLYDFDLQDRGSLPVAFDYNGSIRYTFDRPNDLIYRLNFTEKSIEIYSLSDHHLIRKIATVGWPIQSIIDKNDRLIVISQTTEITNSQSKIIIERF